MAVIKALVPFTTARQRFAPIVSAHFFSNSVTTPARDHTPLRRTFRTCSSSVAGFHIGHTGQDLVLIFWPPSIAGISVLVTILDKETGPNPMATAAPKPANEFCLTNSRLE